MIIIHNVNNAIINAKLVLDLPLIVILVPIILEILIVTVLVSLHYMIMV